MSKTEDALKEAFAGESQANRKYLAFAAKADQEGFPRPQGSSGPRQMRKRSMPTTTCGRSRPFAERVKISPRLWPARRTNSSRCTRQ